MGRPAVENPRQAVSARLHPDEIKNLEHYAKRRGLTRSAAIRQAVLAATAT